MIVKGIVSAVYTEERKVSVILPEYDNITTNPLPIYGKPEMSEFTVNDFVVVMVFNNNLNDAMVISTSQNSENQTGDKHFVHSQNTASAVWTITHGLGKYPAVTVIDSAGTEVIGDVNHIDTNTVQITFSAAFSGKAYFN